MKSLIIKKPTPHNLRRISKFYNLKFLQETEKIGQISSMPTADAKGFLEESYGLFLETHTGSVYSIALTQITHILFLVHILA